MEYSKTDVKDRFSFSANNFYYTSNGSYNQQNSSSENICFGMSKDHFQDQNHLFPNNNSQAFQNFNGGIVQPMEPCNLQVNGHMWSYNNLDQSQAPIINGVNSNINDHSIIQMYNQSQELGSGYVNSSYVLPNVNDGLSCINARKKVYGKKCKNKNVNRDNGSPNEVMIKGSWTPEEDRLLMELVRMHGPTKWSTIAAKIKGRAGKQCRERWHNHVKPNIKKAPWSEQEEMIFINMHKMLGNSWAKITKYLPGRTENAIKNHWNAAKRRQITKLNQGKDNMPKSNLLQNYIEAVMISSPSSISSACYHSNSSFSRMKKAEGTQNGNETRFFFQEQELHPQFQLMESKNNTSFKNVFDIEDMSRQLVSHSINDQYYTLLNAQVSAATNMMDGSYESVSKLSSIVDESVFNKFCINDTNGPITGFERDTKMLMAKSTNMN